MTRINSAIPPKNLTDQHLIAELRELPRIFTAVNKRLEQRKGFDDIPEKFTLGTGHCKFFYNKTAFLYLRHDELRDEYKCRFDKDWRFVPKIEFFRNNIYYSPTQEERKLLIDHISIRIWESVQIPRYYGGKISRKEAIEILKS